MHKYTVSWNDIKNFATTNGTKIQWYEFETFYVTTTNNIYFDLVCEIAKTNPKSTDQTDFETNYKVLNVPKLVSNEYGALNVHVLKTMEPSSKAVSHWWNDKTTWYQKSTRVLAEVLTDSGNGLIFNSAKANWINLFNGKIYQEDKISAPYIIKIYINDVIQTSGYTIDYKLGKVTFDSSQSGKTIKADYSHENGSEWCLAPTAGKMINIEHTEIQFSGDIKIPNKFYGDAVTTWFDFDIWVYNPANLPNKIPYKNTRYKSETDIINDANLAYTHPKFGNLKDTSSNGYITMPFNYGSLQALKSSQGAELRISLKDDAPIEGSFATVTINYYSRNE